MSCLLSSFAVGVVQVRACRRKATRGVDTQGRRGRDTGSYADRGERREVRAWAARAVKELRRHDAHCGSALAKVVRKGNEIARFPVVGDHVA